MVVELESLKPQISNAAIEHGLELLPHISHPQNLLLLYHFISSLVLHLTAPQEVFPILAKCLIVHS
jgi:hypothetical protein